MCQRLETDVVIPPHHRMRHSCRDTMSQDDDMFLNDIHCKNMERDTLLFYSILFCSVLVVFWQWLGSCRSTLEPESVMAPDVGDKKKQLY